MQEYFAALAGDVMNAIPAIISAILILIVSYYGGVLLSRLLQRVLERQNAETGVKHLLTRTLKWTIIVLGVITALQKFFNVTAFLTGLGIIGFTVGFALQNIMQNFVSGVILLVQQPFKTGDSVDIAGHHGTVLKIGLRTTEMKTLDGRIVFLPNASVLSQPIINYTRARFLRVELTLSVAYAADAEIVRKVIRDEIRSIPGAVDSPAPLVLFQAFGASSMEVAVHFWVDTTAGSPAAAKDAALIGIKGAFKKNRIETPYPL